MEVENVPMLVNRVSCLTLLLAEFVALALYKAKGRQSQGNQGRLLGGSDI